MQLKAKHSHIEISPYTAGTNLYLENKFRVWDAPYYRYNDITIDIKDDILRLPRGVELNSVAGPLGIDIDFDYDPDPYTKIDVKLITPPRDENQTSAINFLSGNGNYISTRANSQLLLTMPPGAGKTYCAIAALSQLKYRTIVICHRTKILQQWVKSIINFTDIEKNEILSLTSNIMNKINDGKVNMDKYKVVIVNHSTISSYTKGSGYDKITELFKKMKIGLKIFDEAHRNFRAMFLLDAYTNTKKTLYLTATPKRSDYNENRIYQNYFSTIPRWGEHVIKGAKKHIIYLAVVFNSNPDYEDKLYVKGYNGYLDKNKYTNHIMEKGKIPKDLVRLYKSLFCDKVGRSLIMTATKDSCKKLTELMSEEFPDKLVGPYYSDITPSEKKEVEENADIIIATTSSLGEGTDIPNLRFVFMVEPFASEVNAFQNPSRLRPLPNGSFSFYVEFIDEGFPDIVKWQKRRLKEFKRYFHSMRVVNMNEVGGE